MKTLIFAIFALVATFSSHSQASLSEEDKKIWRYKALDMVEISPPFLQDDTSGQRFLCVRVFNRLPFVIKEAWFHFENGDENIGPRDGTPDWQLQNVAAGEVRIVRLRPRRHIRGNPGESVIQSMIVPAINLCAYWPIEKKEPDPWKCKY